MNDNPFLDLARIRAALNGLDVRPSKDLGQNFLIDPAALAAVVGAAELQPDDTVIEVGPGLGVLTYELVHAARRVIAIEFDRRLAERLPDAVPAPALEIIQRDVLQVDPAVVLGATTRYKLVANLPYQITSAILRHFLEATPTPELMVVMVQWEVAQRIVAHPPEMSVLAHSVQLYAEPEIITRVPAAAFWPSPQVDSAVLRLRTRAHPEVAPDEIPALFRVIKASFLQARKQLANALPTGLASFGVSLEKPAAIEMLKAIGIAPARRPETLSLEEWATIARALVARGYIVHRPPQ